MGEMESTAKTRSWVGQPGVLRSGLRSGSLQAQIAGYNGTVVVDSKLEIRSLVLIPVKLAGFNQIG